MFGSLKKRLNDAIKKVSKTIKEEKPEEKPEEQPKEEQITETQEELEKKEEQKETGLQEEIKEEPEPEAKEDKEVEKTEEKQEPVEQEEIIERPEEPVKQSPEELPPSTLIEEKKEEIKEELKPEIKIEEKIEEPIAQMPEAVKKKEPKKEKKGFLKRIFGKVEEKKLSENDIKKILDELQIALLENDVALDTAELVCSDLKKELLEKTVKRGKVEEAIRNALKKSVLDAMKQEKFDLEEMIKKKYSETKEPFTIIFVGFNGTGKTTTMAKVANKFKDYKPILAAGDTFRAASIEQLEEHAKRLGAEVVKHKYGADSAAVIFDAVKHAKAIGSKLVLADTAGRSHSNVNLMDELQKVVRVNNPDMKILVLDSITGNDIYNQSRLFNESVGVDAMILTKADVYAKGGACLSASHTINKPILYIGTGQEYKDLKEFNPEEIVENLFG